MAETQPRQRGLLEAINNSRCHKPNEGRGGARGHVDVPSLELAAVEFGDLEFGLEY